MRPAGRQRFPGGVPSDPAAAWAGGPDAPFVSMIDAMKKLLLVILVLGLLGFTAKKMLDNA